MMRRIFVIGGLALLLASCSKVGKRFDQRNTGSPGAAQTGTGGTSSGGGGATGAGSMSSTDATDGQAVERPQPTAAQLAAIEGGQEAKWDQQGITWTVPKGWVKDRAETTMFTWRSPGGGDYGFLIANVSPLSESFPTDISLKAMYDQTVERKKQGQVEEVRWLELDGVKGVALREAPPENKEDARRIQWIAYRKYAGQTQMLILTLNSTGRSFDKWQDALYGILYSTKLVH
ncbi:MAG TPA: hypothetical protein VJT74_14025 [Pyrinomonadaceae bacterium]|nr:hypothetical protein [Pyrinomonadaceae bacterium]